MAVIQPAGACLPAGPAMVRRRVDAAGTRSLAVGEQADEVGFGCHFRVSAIRIRYIMELSSGSNGPGLLAFDRNHGLASAALASTAVAVISMRKPSASSSLTTTVARTG